MTYEILPGRPNAGRSGAGRPDAGRPGAGRAGAGSDDRTRQVYEVGDFHQGDEASRWVLRRYLLARALGTSVLMSATIGVVVLAALTVGVWFTGVHWLSVLIGILTFAALLARTALSRIVRWLSGSAQLGPIEPQVAALVGRTRRGLRRELRTAGLPHSLWAPLSIARRLVARDRRAETTRRLAAVDLSKVVSAAELDELHLLLRAPAPR